MTARRIRSLLPALLLIIAGTSACSSVGERDPQSSGASDLLVVDSGNGVTALRAGDGSIAFEAPAELAMPGRSELVSTHIDGGDTVVATLDPVSGEPSSTARLQGELAVRVVSADGSMVALMAPPVDGQEPWVPVPRASTEIIVADAQGTGVPPERYRLRGNFEPEAFSSDGGHMFLISYVPPLDPSAYRVASLDLASGRVEDVFGRDKAPSETMGGTRLNQVLAPEGDRLYTLYTDQPSEYAEGYGAGADGYGAGADASAGGWDGASSSPVAFVHTLSLEDQWAFCAGLPRGFGSASAEATAIAVSPDGRRVFVVDTDHGLIAELAARSMEVARLARVDLGRLTGGSTMAGVGGDGRTLYIGRGDAIVSIDTDAMRASPPWSLGGTLVGLTLSPDGRRLYAAVPGRIEQLEASTGTVETSISAPGLTGIAAIKAIGP
jgi:hypothetical protein